MYVKAARALQVPVALEVSRSGVGAHAWVFFTSPVPAETARRLGAGLLREAMSLSRRMTWPATTGCSPPRTCCPLGGVGNLIAAPLFRPARDKGATVFLDLETLEPHEDQWAYLSALGRMTPQEVRRPPTGPGRSRSPPRSLASSAPGSTETRPAGSRLRACPACGWDPGRAGGTDAGAGRDAAARGVDAQPAVLRAAADARLNLEHPPVPAQLRRDPRRRPGPAARHARQRHRAWPRRRAAAWRSPTSAPQAREQDFAFTAMLTACSSARRDRAGQA